jgi:hypothetical protein
MTFQNHMMDEWSSPDPWLNPWTRMIFSRFTLRATMTNPTKLTFRHITAKALERAKFTISYALLEA